MPVTIQTPQISYFGNGATTVFAYDFYILADEQIAVYLDGVKQVSGFTIAGAGVPSGGSITFTTAPGNGVVVLIRRETPLTRQTDWLGGSAIVADTLDADSDKLTQIVQEISDRALQIAPDGTVDMGGATIINIGAPVDPDDAATKEYVDAVLLLAEEWANKAEDSLVSAEAGGDGVDDYSALHWAAKAEQYATDASFSESAAAVFQSAAAIAAASAESAQTAAETAANDAQAVFELIQNARVYKGVWDASSGVYPSSPTLGDYYKVNVAGTISGTPYTVNDDMIYNGATWDKVDFSDSAAANLDASVIVSGTFDDARLPTNQTGKNFSTNVGVGTTSPTNTAGYSSVTLDGSTGSLLELRAATAPEATLTVTGSTTVFNSNNDLTFSLSSVTRLTLGASSTTLVGDLGIGNTITATGTEPTISFVESDASNKTWNISGSGSNLLIKEATTTRLTVAAGGDVTVGGTMTAGTFSGSGASLTSLNATNLSSGTVADGRLPTSQAGKTFTSKVTSQSSTSPSLTVERTGSTSNGLIEFKTTAGSMHAGVGVGGTFAIGASSDLSTGANRYLELTSSKLLLGNKSAIQFSDTWMRLNPDGDSTSGIYTGSGLLRSDGQLQVGSTSTNGFYTSTSQAPLWTNKALLRHAGSYTSGAITVSTSAPSGGSNGDIWLQV